MDEQYRNMLYELSLQEAIQQQLDVLVLLAMQTVVDYINLEEMENSQLRNLVNVAATANSIEIVTNFIRYQIGRNENEAWGGKDKKDFGHEVIKAIEGRVKDLTEEAIQVMQERIKKRSVNNDIDLQNPELAQFKKLAYQRLTEFYIGYLNRCFYYAKKTSKDSPSGLNEMKETLKIKDKMEATNANG